MVCKDHLGQREHLDRWVCMAQRACMGGMGEMEETAREDHLGQQVQLERLEQLA